MTIPPEWPRPDTGWTDQEWWQYENAWLHVAAKYQIGQPPPPPPKPGFSWSILGWNEAKKAWITGLLGTVGGALAPLFVAGRPPTWEDVWMPAAGAVLGYFGAWIPKNKPPEGPQVK